MKNIAILAALLALAGACKPKAPEPLPRPQAGNTGQGGRQSDPLSGPRNYVETAAGRLEKAQAAKMLFERTEQARLKELGLAGGGR